ncbi:MAG: hypothetical protein EAX96_08355 [Candidatus Lokiarchaeota archaeon]|nr:hypothetical protein [Candidatus Lokiarchaeota archaeon]
MEEKRFEEMVKRIVKTSDLSIEGGRLGNSIKDELSLDQGRKGEFIKRYKQTWDQFKGKYGKHVISPFIEWAGPSIIKNFLSYVLAFREEKINPVCSKKGTNVDALLCVDYIFPRQDLNTIKKILDTYKVNIEEKEAAKMLISNSIKALSILLNDILEMSYRLYTAAIDIEDLGEEGLKIALKYDGRIG